MTDLRLHALPPVVFIAMVGLSTSVNAQSDEPTTNESTAAADAPTLPTLNKDQPQVAGPLSALVRGQLFAGYTSSRSGDQSFSEFELSRGEAMLELKYKDVAGAEITIEAIRSAGAGSLLGVDGDSLVVRAKRAWGYGRARFGVLTVEGRGGLIPDPWIESVEGDYDLRALSATAGERAEFYDTSDVGAALRFDVSDSAVSLQVAATNGEGRNLGEQNSGKNTTAVLRVRPLKFAVLGDDAALTLHVGGREGSVGTAQVRAHRLSGGATLAHPLLAAGFESTRAYGASDRAEMTQSAMGGWLSARPLRYAGVAGRVDLINRDRSQDDATQTSTTIGVFAQPLGDQASGLERFRVYAAYQRDRFGDMGGAFGGVPEASTVNRFLVVFSMTAAGEWNQ